MANQDERVLFFDVGNVFINDDPFLCEAFRLIYEPIDLESPKADFDRYRGDVERALRAYGHLAVDRLGHRIHGRAWPKLKDRIGKTISSKWDKLVHPIPGSLKVLKALKSEYKMAIIANQPARAADYLEKNGILEYFDVVVLDADKGVAKPDPALFRFGLEEAKADPAESVMIGDRLDNDVIPARRLGLRAVLFQLHARDKGWRPEDEWGLQFMEILMRLPLPRWDAFPPKERPLALARKWDELPEALEKAYLVKL